MSYPVGETLSTIEEPFAEADFVEGRVESMTNPDAPIFMTWPHGDETLGPRTQYHLYSERKDLLPYVDYLCGNPQAASQDPAARYVDEDLNRAYRPGAEPGTYEQKRAQRTREMIDEGGYRFILDMHTTVVEQEDCIILDGRILDTPPVQEILAASPVRHIVVFPPEIAQQGLIGNVPGSVSVEYNRRLADEVGVDHMATTIEGLVRGEPLHDPLERQLFHVDGLIPKSEDPGLDAKNFEVCADGYIPVLFGENSYRKDPTKNYLGFRAIRSEVVVL